MLIGKISRTDIDTKRETYIFSVRLQLQEKYDFQ